MSQGSRGQGLRGEDNMKKILMSVMIGLCFFMSQPLFAGAESTQFTMTPRAQKIFDQAPQTPEALLKLTKEFMDNPNINGYEFVEKISGIDRKHWGIGSKRQGFGKNKSIVYQEYYPRCPKCTYNLRGEVERKLPTPYSVGEIKTNVKDDRLVDITVKFLSSVSELSNIDFVITPAIFREILGKPTRTYVTSPWPGGFSVGFYYLDYFYESEGYELSISFSAPGDEDQELRRKRMNHTAEQMRAERRRRKKFANHKDFRAVSFRITPSN